MNIKIAFILFAVLCIAAPGRAQIPDTFQYRPEAKVIDYGVELRMRRMGLMHGGGPTMGSMPAIPLKTEADRKAAAFYHRSRAPYAVFDVQQSESSLEALGRGVWPAVYPPVAAGKTVIHQLKVFSEAVPAALRLEVRPRITLSDGKVKTLKTVSAIITVTRKGGTPFKVPIALPQVSSNSRYTLKLLLWRENKLVFSEELPFVATPPNGTTARLIARDDATKGNWPGVYGKEAFLVPNRLGRSAFQLPNIVLRRGTGLTVAPKQHTLQDSELAEEQQMIVGYAQANTLEDERLPVAAPGLKERPPVAFSSDRDPIIVRADATDKVHHILSLYILDFARKGFAVDVDLVDLNGNILDSRHYVDAKEGFYLSYDFSGAVIAQVKFVGTTTSTLSGLFVDPMRR